MEEGIKIQIDPLRSKNLFIATPAYGGQVNALFEHSMLRLQKLLMECGIPHRFQNMSNESLITRARNGFAAQFLQTDCTHLMFIDSDIEFQAEDVIGLLHFDKDIIGGSYPCKGIDWGKIKKAVQLHPDITPDDLALCGAIWTAHFFEGSTTINPYEPVEVAELATGFTLFSRKVFETLLPLMDKYQKAPNEPAAFPEEMTDFFRVGVHEGRYESEDYSLCRAWREQGGKVFLAPWMRLNHVGTFAFRGDPNRVLQLLGEAN